MDQKQKQKIDELLYLMLENAATAEQVRLLDALVASNVEIQGYVIEYYYITAALHKTNVIPSAFFGTSHEVNEQYNLLLALGQEEMNAPVLELPEEPLGYEDTPRTIKVEKGTRKINKMAYAVAIVSMAALLIMIAYIRTFPPRESVAVLMDTIDAQWQNTSEEVEVGHLFHNTDVPMLLRSGIVEIEFGYGAKTVIEGPAEFACKSNSQITLNYGRLYARIPKQATGFTVETASSRIVDLGTEFGVQANVDQTTEVHVLKGRTTLISGKDKNSARDVLAGQARKVADQGKSVEEVSLKENSFVRHINSKTGLIVKRRDVDLADIVGSGNGFGAGQTHLAIDPATSLMRDVQELNRVTDNSFTAMPGNPFIDGVFVPNGQSEQIVTSSGHLFSECPETKGNYYTGIINSPLIIDRDEVVLGGVNYSQTEAACIFIHANLGITFDLHAIRSQFPDIEFTRFQSTIGISDTAPRQCNADFWILVDGQIRYQKQGVNEKGIADFVDIELNENDRFLTLIATDGGDSNLRPVGTAAVESIDSDWCVFAEPVLLLN